ncbi:carboxypeptidase-like regulatory domain-containing protein [Bizionia sp. KMM 8389]
MKLQLLSMLFILVIFEGFSQNVQRIEVQGKIIAKSDVEGVTIFNKSSNEGTVADEAGDFVVEVALGDVLEVSALQYEARTVTITQGVVDSKRVRLFLVEALNTLSEVVLLPTKLTGDLLVDINNAEVQKAIVMSFGDISNLEFPEDAFTKPVNEITREGEFYNGVNFASIIGINKWLNKSQNNKSSQLSNADSPLGLSDIYTVTYINETYDIPVDKVADFFEYCMDNGFDANLLGEENELKRIAFLEQQSQSFLNKLND